QLARARARIRLYPGPRRHPRDRERRPPRDGPGRHPQDDRLTAMADVTIGELTPAAALDPADKVEIEKGSAPTNSSVYATLAQLRAFALTSPENVQTGTSYTLVLADAFRLVAMDNASPNTLTVPPNS